jgi:hypothetical protein
MGKRVNSTPLKYEGDLYQGSLCPQSTKRGSQSLTAGPAVLGKRNKEFENFFKGMKSESLKGANDCEPRSFIK